MSLCGVLQESTRRGQCWTVGGNNASRPSRKMKHQLFTTLYVFVNSKH